MDSSPASPKYLYTNHCTVLTLIRCDRLLKNSAFSSNLAFCSLVLHDRYSNNDGGLIVKTFGENKALWINAPEDYVECHAKWNITVEYDKHGFLVKEKFETINAHKDDDEKSVYGEARYSFK